MDIKSSASAWPDVDLWLEKRTRTYFTNILTGPVKNLDPSSDQPFRLILMHVCNYVVIKRNLKTRLRFFSEFPEC